MARSLRYIIVRQSKAAAINAWLQDHPDLDPRGGGDQTFVHLTLALTADPDDGSVVRAYGASWELPVSWWNKIRDKVISLGWKINTTDADNDISHYTSGSWTVQQVLNDVTRKPAVLKVVQAET
jgi:hypothetical protein